MDILINSSKVLPEYDPLNNHLKFRISEEYEIIVRSFEEKRIDRSSICKDIPLEIFCNNMFPFFSAYELFKMRCVSSEWRDMVRSMWHLIFKREMFE